MIMYKYKYHKYLNKYKDLKCGGGSSDSDSDIINEYRQIYDRLERNLDRSSVENPSLIREKMANCPIYYINLDRSSDRRDWLEGQFQKFGLDNVQRIRGIDGDKVRDETNNTPTNIIKNSQLIYQNGDDKLRITIINPDMNPDEKYPLSLGQLGCCLSHLRAIQTSYRSGDNYALILEDDCYLGTVPLWEKNITEIMREAPSDWEIIKLWNQCLLDNNKTLLEKCNSYSPKGYYRDMDISWKGNNMGTLAYLINRRGMKHILDHVGATVTPITDTRTGTDHYLLRGRPGWKPASIRFLLSDRLLYNIRPQNVYITRSLLLPNFLLNSLLTKEPSRRAERHIKLSLPLWRYYLSLIN